MLIKDIKPDAQSYNVDSSMFYVSGTRDTIIKDRETLDLIIDEPCLEACRYLFDCNILTQNSSANQTDLSSGSGYITIDYKTLDEHNKKVYEELVQRGIATEYSNVYFNHNEEEGLIVAQPFTIKVPLTEKSDSEEVSQLFLEIAKEFSPQELLYGSYSREEMGRLAIHAFENDNYCSVDDNAEEIPHFASDVIIPKYGEDITLEELINEYNDNIAHYYYDEENDKYWISEELYKKSLNKPNSAILQ